MGLLENLDDLRGNRVTINNKNNKVILYMAETAPLKATVTVKIKTMTTKIYK